MANALTAVLSRLDKFGRFAENAALVILLGSLVILAVGQIVLREVFETGIFWADELIKLLVLWLAMVGSIAATRDNRHIRVDALSHLLPENIVTVLRLVVDTFAAIVCGVIAWHGGRFVHMEFTDRSTAFAGIPSWTLEIVIPFTFAVIAARYLLQAVQALRTPPPRS